MALGKAFIEVHADTTPFARELGRELTRIINAAEKDVKASAGQLGKTIADETGNGIERNRKSINRGLNRGLLGTETETTFTRLVKGIVDTIDDGLSGLPAEIKAVLGAGLAAALPIAVAIGGGIASALTTGFLLAGGAAFGVLIGTQFEEVSAYAEQTFLNLRRSFLENAAIFTGNFFVAINAVRDRFAALEPELVIIFAKITRTFEPIVDAVFNLVESAIPGISAAFDDIDRFLVPLQGGFALIGDSIGHFFETITANEDAPRVFADILLSISQLIDLFTWAVDLSISWYGVLLDIGQALGLIADAEKELKPFAGTYERTAEGAATYNGVIQNTIKLTEAEEKAIKDLNQQLDTLTGLLFDSKQGEIDFERALDDLTASVDENGRSLDISKEAGRQNSEALLALAQSAITARQTQIDLTGDVDAAQRAFEAQRAKIYEVARNLGLSEEATRDLIGALLGLPPPKDTGVTKGSVTRMQTLLGLLRAILPLLPGLGVVGSVLGAVPQAHADGGVFTQPHVGLVAEAGPEAIIPLNNPQRASEIMAEAGLAGSMSPTVNVYLGNEQFRAYVAAVANQEMAASARAMSYGTRGI